MQQARNNIPKSVPLQVTGDRKLSKHARKFYIPQSDIEQSLPDNEEVDAERAFQIWDAASVLVNERYGQVDSKVDLIKLVNHLLCHLFMCADIEFEDQP